MKKNLLLILFVGVFCLKLSSQTPFKIVSKIQKGDINFLLQSITLPFTMDDTTITGNINIDSDKQKLENYLKKYFDSFTLKEFRKGRIIKNNSLEYSIETKDFNDEGELEAESSIVFYFKKIKRKYYLYKIMIAG